MNAPLRLQQEKVSTELWICAALCWFGKTRLAKPSGVFGNCNFDEQLAARFAWNISEFQSRFSTFPIAHLDVPGPMLDLSKIWNIGSEDIFLLLLCGENENNYWINLAISELHSPQVGIYPKVHFVCALINSLFGKGLSPIALAHHPLIQKKIITLHQYGPLPQAELSIDASIWLSLSGNQTNTLIPEITVIGNANTGSSHPAIDGDVTDVYKKPVAHIALQYRLNQHQLVRLIGSETQGLAFATALAHSLDLIPVILNERYDFSAEKIAVLALLQRWLVIRILDVDKVMDLAPLPEKIPQVWITQSDKPLQYPQGLMPQNFLLEYRFPLADAEARQQSWLAWVEPALATALAQRWLLHGDQIIQLMKGLPAIAPGVLPNEQDIVDARFSKAVTSLYDFAFLVPRRVSKPALVIPEVVARDLEQLIQRCKAREQIWNSLGLSAQAGKNSGIRALFSGESGTGKTLAASYVATQLGMPLYRLDLGSIVNKYVGETEKNLGRVLDEVAERDFILLIDEADALFGKRTDAGSSGERFANMLTNFLLSRMESHRGIIILTTNGFSRIDSAFLRRLECIIEFQAPEMEERVRLWSAHLGERNPGEHYCRLLASLCDLSGGFIRNAVLAAAAEVPYEQSSALSFNQLLYSIASEYRKSGKPVPPKLASYLVSSPRPDSSGA